MGYKVLGRTEELLKGYGPRKGLEGPFVFMGGRVLYYDPKQGQYWDPNTDFYIEHDEMARIQNQLFEAMR
jgi:hypothetical protein